MFIAGALIKALRKAAGLTQREVAEWLDVSEKQVRNWEKGKHVPGGAHLAKLVDVLQGDLSEVARLLEGPDPSKDELERLQSKFENEGTDAVRRAAWELLENRAPYRVDPHAGEHQSE